MDTRVVEYDENGDWYIASICEKEESYFVTLANHTKQSEVSTCYFSAYIAWCDFCDISNKEYKWNEVPKDVVGDFTVYDYQTYTNRMAMSGSLTKKAIANEIIADLNRYCDYIENYKETKKDVMTTDISVLFGMSMVSMYYVTPRDMFNDVYDKLLRNSGEKEIKYKNVRGIRSYEYEYRGVTVCYVEEDK